MGTLFFLYRRRLEYGLVYDPHNTISDDDLKDTIKQLRRLQPYCGVSMVWDNLRARGIKVTRERVRSMLRAIDPLEGFCVAFLLPSEGSRILYRDQILCGI